MKEKTLLKHGWKLRKIENADYLDIDLMESLFTDGKQPGERVFHVDHMPKQVPEILIENHVIDNPNIQGNSEKCLWIGECDWLYQTEFAYRADERPVQLTLKGLDTFVDIYLNQELIGSHNDVYLPKTLDVTDKVRAENCLLLHFHSSEKRLDRIELPQGLEGRVKRPAKARVYHSAYGDYLGPKPRPVRVGVYDEIYLEKMDACTIEYLDIRTVLDNELKNAKIGIAVACAGNLADSGIVAILKDPGGAIIGKAERQAEGETCGTTHMGFHVENPQLWWPRLHGKQPLYTIEAEILSKGFVRDRQVKKIGIRKVQMVGDLDFQVNNQPIKLYGANLAPLDTVTNRYDKARMGLLLQLAENAHFECFRVWGEDERLDDDFYEQCDERGFLLWQDFFSGYTMYNLDKEMEGLFREEAEYQVKRLKHHASILMWCGGNESLMMRDYEYPGEEYIGQKVLDEIYPQVCRQFDPDRYYHRSSPDGGSYANDPLGGDTHGYTHIWYVPGSYYPVFLSENCRVSTPALRTMQVMMDPEDLWPEGYCGQQGKNSEGVWPDQWNKYNSNFGYWKLGEVEKFYDGTDLDAMLYRIGWGHGLYIRSRVERYRRGYPVDTKETCERITKGHLLWKFNNSCNHIFFGIVDYFMEPYIPYYSLKRAYAPVLLSFEVGNFIKLYLTNDSPEAIRGKVYIQLFNPLKNACENRFEVPFEVDPDQSKVLTDLNCFGQFKNNNILYAYAVNENGERIAESVDYCEMERRMRFPTDARLSMEWLDGELMVSTDKYARSIELLGFGEDGDAFGWVFDDNYFDLLPGEVKKVRIVRGKSRGKITAKPYYSEETTTINRSDPASRGTCGPWMQA